MSLSSHRVLLLLLQPQELWLLSRQGPGRARIQGRRWGVVVVVVVFLLTGTIVVIWHLSSPGLPAR